MCVIPARSGSKGLPGKNIKNFAGKPLIAHSIDIALNCHPVIDRVVVSTDCERIRDLALEHGAEVPFLRPPDLATDESHTIDVIKDLLSKLSSLEDYNPDWILLLQPTSPIRDIKDLLEPIKIAKQGECSSVIGVKEISGAEIKKYMTSNAGRLVPKFSTKHPEKLRRQDQTEALFSPNGSIYLTQSKNIKATSFYGDQPVKFVMPKHKSIDIDDLFDFMVAEFIFKSGVNSDG